MKAYSVHNQNVPNRVRARTKYTDEATQHGHQDGHTSALAYSEHLED